MDVISVQEPVAAINISNALPVDAIDILDKKATKIQLDITSKQIESNKPIYNALDNTVRTKIYGTSDLPSWLRRFRCNRALIEQTGADFGLVAPELAVLRPPTPDFGQTRPHAISFLRTRNKLPRANSVKSCARFLARPR